jgi:uncharacterized cysteine cluster protein YcgN (CxxCxxCC family)
MRDNESAPAPARPFWQTKTLAEMTRAEWESLCDGCGLCCLRKLEDSDTGEIVYTNVACRLLDCDTCRCTRYERRLELVDDCIGLTPERLDELRWMPSTCAYRLVDAGRPLPDWHPLISGKTASVHEAGISARGRCVSERHVHEDEVEDRIVGWVSA